MQRELMNTTYLQSRISDLHSLHGKTVSEYGDLVESLNKECDIFCDIIPGYKISKTIEEESGNNIRKKKEVYNVERLEHELLTQYEHFLQLLKKLQRKNHPEQQALGSRIVAKLLPCAHEFNHNDTLLKLTVSFCNSKATRVAQPALKALGELLDGQMISETTEFVVSAILAIVRSQKYAINPKLLNTLLHIRVAMIDTHKKDLTEEKAKNKRLKKEDKELARQMMKANARRDRSELAVKQTRIIQKIFVVYLRMLEASQSCTKMHQAKVLAPTLEGLVKFAPLVNVELYHTLMKALRELVDEEDTTVATKLHALVAVASLTQKDATLDASEWRVDLTHFHEVLFQCLSEALEAPKNEEAKKTSDRPEEEEDVDDAASQGSTSSAGTLSSQAFSIAQSMAQAKFVKDNSSREWTYRVGLVLRTVDLLILTQKHIPLVRVTAILRRLLQSIPSVPPHIGVSLTALCHRLILRYPAAHCIVVGGSDNMIGGRGSYNPEASDTANAHAECSFAWEQTLLAKSFHPTQRSIATSWSGHYHKLSKYSHGQAPVVSARLNAMGPYEALEAYDPSLGDINPAPPQPGSLRKRSANKNSKNTEGEASDDDEELVAPQVMGVAKKPVGGGALKKSRTDKPPHKKNNTSRKRPRK